MHHQQTEPKPVQVTSRDHAITVDVNSWGQPLGVVLEPAARKLTGAELSRRILALYAHAKLIALAVRNVEHYEATGAWMPSWPTPTHVTAATNALTV